MFCSVEVLTGETCREECRAESKIEKLVSGVTNSVVKSLIEFSTIAESDLPIPSIKANAIMMGIRYLMSFFTPLKWVFLYAFCNTPSHDNFVCKDSAFFWILRCFFSCIFVVHSKYFLHVNTHSHYVFSTLPSSKVQANCKQTVTINTHSQCVFVPLNSVNYFILKNKLRKQLSLRSFIFF